MQNQTSNSHDQTAAGKVTTYPGLPVKKNKQKKKPCQTVLPDWAVPLTGAPLKKKPSTIIKGQSILHLQH